MTTRSKTQKSRAQARKARSHKVREHNVSTIKARRYWSARVTETSNALDLEPKMRRFIFAERNGIHIIDLQKTLRQIELAQKLVREVVLRGDNILFVCTKRQLAAIVRGEAERSGSLFVTERWLGGLLTNFQTIKKQIRRLKELEAGTEAGGEFENYTKKEQLLLTRQRDKLSKYLQGIKHMGRPPGLLVVIDSRKERIAVSEANKLGIPIVAIVDTNADPDLITVPIAGNDDAIRSVELITRFLAEAIAEARREAPVRTVEEEAEESMYSSDRGLEPAAAGHHHIHIHFGHGILGIGQVHHYLTADLSDANGSQVIGQGNLFHKISFFQHDASISQCDKGTGDGRSSGSPISLNHIAVDPYGPLT